MTALTDDPMLVRKTFAHFPSGVSFLSAERDDHKHALVASSFMVGVSLEPCLVAFAVQKSSETWPLLRDAERIGVSVAGEGQADLTRKLAGRDRARRFEEVSHSVEESGAVFIDGAALWLECSVYSESDAGDHWLVLLEVRDLGMNDIEPLVWHGSRFRGLALESSVDVE
ncbi:flavin reductase family protein [Subtercola frigoramans]|uniref:Flavin reductase (DIM6/NTAB) family NADH-FMN oxidoreductase RutF n=1 Tax=Subtercola frigoramans TaxID=120298 RepID=A0ABS2LAY3_9MICO|nr:flavin reductase family protein [Subtercola frigoramans]MBM7473641.1 flavin reductase (DIM6/NTAB) family NADH-FMN oxidoreductase RutF [Subtercola frigoramans]